MKAMARPTVCCPRPKLPTPLGAPRHAPPPNTVEQQSKLIHQQGRGRGHNIDGRLRHGCEDVEVRLCIELSASQEPHLLSEFEHSLFHVCKVIEIRDPHPFGRQSEE
jgi:hypothetical protein